MPRYGFLDVTEIEAAKGLLNLVLCLIEKPNRLHPRLLGSAQFSLVQNSQAFAKAFQRF